MKKTNRLITLLITVTLLLCVLSVGLSVSVGRANDHLDLEFMEKRTFAYLGEQVDFAKYTLLYPEYVEKVDIKIISPSNKEVALSNGKFRATEEGDFTVCLFVVGVKGGKQDYSYKVSVAKANFPVLTSEIVLPSAFISGEEYKVVKANFVDYSNGATPVIAKTYIIDSAGEREVFDAFTPSVTVNGETVTLKYVAGTTVKEFYLPVYKVISKDNYGTPLYDFSKMFITEGVNTVSAIEGGLSFGITSGVAGFTYINPVNADFGISLKTVQGKNNFDTVEITLTDYENPLNYLTVEIDNSTGKQSSALINGKTVVDMNGSLSESFASGIGLSFSNSNLSFSDIKGTRFFTVKNNALAQSFEGFAGKRVYVSVKIKNITASSEIILDNLCSQYFGSTEGNINEDGLEPFIVLKDVLTVEVPLNCDVTVPRAMAIDVLDVGATGTLTVTGSDGVVKDINGEFLSDKDFNENYTFTVTKHGEYKLHYVGEDKAGNICESWYTVYCIDSIAPTIVLEKQIDSTVALDTKVVMPNVTVSDDVSTIENIISYYAIIAPNGDYFILNANDEFTFLEKGKYSVRYYCYDEFFNYAGEQYFVICK